MDYLDYLAEYTYDQLPDAVRATISRADYTGRRQLVLALREPEENALPPELGAAFLARTQDAKKVERSKVSWLPWLAAAGWLLFLGVSGILLLREPETLLVEKTVFAPAPAPEIMHTTDTLYQTVTEYKYRTKTVYDTVFLTIPTEQLVYVRDTLYLLAEQQTQGYRGSSSLQGKERMLTFLFTTE